MYKNKKSPVIPILISAVLLIGIAVLLIQVFHPFTDSGQNAPNHGDYSTDGNLPNGQLPNDSQIPQVGGDEKNYGKDPWARRGANGKMEYSIDGGKTWSNTPPDGYEGLPDYNGS